LEWIVSADHFPEEMPLVTIFLAAAAAQGVVFAPPTVVAALRAGSGCVSTVAVTNLSGRRRAAEIQARLETGALVLLEPVEPPRDARQTEPRGERRGEPSAATIDRAQRSPVPLDEDGFTFAPHQTRSFLLAGDWESANAWVGVWEADPPGTLPALVVEGSTECIEGNQLRTVRRSAALAMRNPWFAGHVADFDGAAMAVVNVSARAARADVCYSAGNLYFVPAEMPNGRLARLCSWSENVVIPPFGSHEFSMVRQGATEFALHTRGDAIVMLVLRPVAAGVRVYQVDSTIRFGSEVAPSSPGR
jgi:hypothetical protein